MSSNLFPPEKTGNKMTVLAQKNDCSYVQTIKKYRESPEQEKTKCYFEINLAW